MFKIYFHGWGGGGGGLDKPIIMLISAPVGFELGLGAELGNRTYKNMLEHVRTFSYMLITGCTQVDNRLTGKQIDNMLTC